MPHECELCGQPISDDERLSDSFHVAVNYHRQCIAKLAVAARWIPVGERLPEDQRDVLMMCRDMIWARTEAEHTFSVHEGYYEADREQWLFPDGEWAEVTHWMEMPGRPK